MDVTDVLLFSATKQTVIFSNSVDGEAFIKKISELLHQQMTNDPQRFLAAFQHKHFPKWLKLLTEFKRCIDN